tara:strand:- start:13 stop:258 length:246 start_codon:yes stop_codon:yes gene_type:complete
MTNTIALPHKCPNKNCTHNTEANSHKELDEKFGYRNMPNGVRSQSWCRDCRKKLIIPYNLWLLIVGGSSVAFKKEVALQLK